MKTILTNCTVIDCTGKPPKEDMTIVIEGGKIAELKPGIYREESRERERIFNLEGGTAVVDDEQRAIGVFTDGDLRRLIEQKQDFSTLLIADVMHAKPRALKAEQLAVEAVELMEEFRINQLLVVDDNNKLVGALHIHDLTRAKVI